MPLKSGYSDKTRNENISELLKSGRNIQQSAAIAYDIQRKAKKKATSRKKARKRSKK